ncbi:MAG: hypothetical protein MI861_18260 [Pirellulales bacterium]|nr:hypothetical protein [Pirellulales bacterium]
MRIPSQFNQDNLYRRGSRRAENVQAYRKLLRLTLGLALVIVVMPQVSRPEIYQTFFGNRRPGEATDSVRPAALVNVRADKTGGPEVTFDAGDRAVARQLTEELVPSDRRQWTVALSRWQTGRQVSAVPSTVESLRLLLEDSAEIEGDRRAKWLAMLEAFQQSVAPTARPGQASEHRVPLTAWLATLDEFAARGVVDGTVWRSGDFETFYRYLDQAPTMNPKNVAATGILPLLQQPDVYRAQYVRVTGAVARAESVPAGENPFGVASYWRLWLRPNDGADRPLLAIVPEVPDVVAAVSTNATEMEGPQVELLGRFLKRLAYTSGKGADLTPVVVGRLVGRPLSPAEQAASAQPVPSGQSSGRTFVILSIACLLGVALAVLAMKRTASAAKHSRQLREARRQKPDDFLSGLGNQ